MGASAFSFLMSLIWCSVFILLSIVWKKTMSLKHGVHVILAVIGIGIVRLVIPIEIPSTVVIRSTLIMPFLQQFFNIEALEIYKFSFSRFDLLIAAWLTGSTIYLICITTLLIRQSSRINKMQSKEILQAQRVLDEIALSYRPQQKYKIIISEEVATPMLVGYFVPVFLLPPLELPDEELKYVLLHEWNHFIHWHLWLKLFFNIFCAILWWNPLVYLAKNDLDYTLEVNCDQYVVRNMNDVGRAKYVESTADVMKQLVNAATRRSILSVGFVSTVPEKIIQRCELILFPPKKLGKWAKRSIIIVIISLVVLSYTFIFQPVTQPPQDGSSSADISITPNNSYLKLNNDGTYTLYLDGKIFDIIDDKSIDKAPYSDLKIQD